MTTTPAMPELPEPELGYIETDKSRQPAFSARQMRAAMQAQPAAVSDADAWELWLRVCAESDNLSTRVMIANFARALRPQAVPMTIKASPKLIGWRTENFLWETDDVDKARNWEPNIGVLPIFEGDPNTKLGSRGITAQAKEGGA